MSWRTAMLLLTLLGLPAALCSCPRIDLPSEQAMVEVFIAESPARLIEPPAPDSVPLLATAELTDWATLCDECHVGPHYSSYTILNWGHLDSCVGELACTDCHAGELHRTDVRGDKGQCFDCHLARSVLVNCETCHIEGCRGSAAAHGPGFLGEHGAQTQWEGIDCLVCHGSQSWCMDCHGLPMPHPDDIIDSHPLLVQGQPETCANCHGSQSCIRCHLALGVVITPQQ